MHPSLVSLTLDERMHSLTISGRNIPDGDGHLQMRETMACPARNTISDSKRQFPSISMIGSTIGGAWLDRWLGHAMFHASKVAKKTRHRHVCCSIAYLESVFPQLWSQGRMMTNPIMDIERNCPSTHASCIASWTCLCFTHWHWLRRTSIDMFASA
jgi:hypothetical protein